MSLINLRNITIAYESNTIVREANFRLNEKERVGLIGKNGTGKTSLLRCLLDELNPTAGEILASLRYFVDSCFGCRLFYPVCQW